jgi:ferritin-like metal-binding protein YciE
MPKIKTIGTLHDLLIHDLRKILDGEDQIISLLPDWLKKIKSSRLKLVLEQYVAYLQYHVDGIEKFFERKKLMSLRVRNNLVRAFIDEVNEGLNECSDSEIADALLISGLQEIIHYKISAYGTISAFAATLDLDISANEFYSNVKDEKEIDSKLSFLAEKEVNPLARSPIVD